MPEESVNLSKMKITDRNLPTNSPAFTLIELLTVIAIIGILSALVLSGIGGARKSARRAQCTANQRQILTAAHLYADENKGVFPRANNLLQGMAYHATSKGIIDRLDLYTGKDRRLFYCTDAAHAYQSGDLRHTYEYQAALTPQPYWLSGYYWTNSDPGGGWNPPGPQLNTGSPRRILISCVTINGYKGIHSGSVNMGFSDGHVQSLKKTINQNVDVNTLELK